MMENELRCRICENVAGNKLHPAREMMFGTREAFNYVECAHCGTVQIAAIPDLTRHYPKEYYSLSDQMPEVDKAFKRRVAARFIGRYVVTGKNRLGRFLNKNRPLIRRWVISVRPLSKWVRICLPRLPTSLTRASLSSRANCTGV